MTDLGTFAEVASSDHWLGVLTTLRPDGTMQSSVVNAGTMTHPITGQPVVALVASGGTQKLRNLRIDPRASIVARAGWRWVAVEGAADIIGPDDAHPEVDADALRLLLREIFRAAGGTHDDWDGYDRAMADDRRAAVMITPVRVYSNPE